VKKRNPGMKPRKDVDAVFGFVERNEDEERLRRREQQQQQQQQQHQQQQQQQNRICFKFGRADDSRQPVYV